ncbi:MAG: hemolysin family protein, partial [Chloroflexota bacterium]
TVQIGITLVGIASGAFGGTALSGGIAEFLSANLPISESLASQLAVGVIILMTTYLSLVIGELVPKRIALSNPEGVSSFIARPMRLLSRITAPIVWLLSKSTELIARLLGVQGDDNNFITDFEVIALMREGIESGEFDTEEHKMVKGALELDDIRTREIMTPRTNIVWFDKNADEETVRDSLRNTRYSDYPICDGTVDNVVGVVRSKDLLHQIIIEGKFDLSAVMREPFFVPETAIAADVLQKFKTTTVHTAVIVDEYGGTAGILTLTDIVEEVLGDLDMQDVEPVQRKDGSWLIDGQYPIIDMPTIFDGFDVPEDEVRDYQTVAGFVLKRIGHIPETSDTVDWGAYRIEVMDMDGKRVDKVLVSDIPDAE